MWQFRFFASKDAESLLLPLPTYHTHKMREVIMTHNMYWKRILSVIIIGLGLTFVQTGKAIEVGLMLPLSGNIQRYVEFYEGMLMGLFRLKKKGVSVTLRVYDVSNTSDAEDVVHSGELNDCHLIIGGTSNDQISVIGRYADRRGINYVVPFSSGKIAGKASANLFQINPPQEYIYPYVARAFMQRFADRSVVFVTGRDEPDACASYIMAEMDKAGRTYSKLAADTGQSELVKMLHALLALIPN